MNSEDLRHSIKSHPLYSTWRGMIDRCTNLERYPNHGGRGISVCLQWRNDFWSFADYMGPKPAGFSIDRINNDGDYEPGNCRWATPSEQNKNSRPKKTRTRSSAPQVEISPLVAAGLTVVEARVVALMAQGLAHSTIAGLLGLSKRTIESHSARAVKKTGAVNHLQLGIWYAKHCGVPS